MTAQRVCLVIPPSLFLLDERVFMSIGVLRVAASLEAAGHQVEVLDLSGVENFVEVAELHARTTRASVFGVTITTPQLPAAVKIARAIGDAKPGARLIAGGPHPTLCAAALKLEAKRGRFGRAKRAVDQLRATFDVVVAGDGEQAIHAALHAPRGMIDADDPAGPLFLTNRAYEAQPLPARHLVDVASYHYAIDGHPATSLIAQLGCPFACGFCGGRNSSMLRRIRTRSTESVVAEVEHLHRAYGFTGFMMYDDELNVNKGLVGLCDALTDLQERIGAEFRFRGFVKSELFTAEQAQAMHRAGFRWLLCGFEAADPRILANINKRATREDNDRMLATAHAAGIKVKALMSVGHAGESEASILAVRDWLIARAPDDFDCTTITTYPGTPYYDEAEETAPGVWTYTAKTGDRLHAYDVDYTTTADYYKGAPGGGYKAYVYTDHLSSEQIVALRDQVEFEARAELGIPFNPGAPGVRYEASMGQLPGHILRGTVGA